MATITGNTKTTTPTNSWAVAAGLFGVLLAIFSCTNLFSTLTPLADLNAKIVDQLAGISALPIDDRIKSLDDLRQEQERALAGKPSEPFAWARLSYMRLATGDRAQDAFAALAMSNLVSPDEPRQLPERALMWRQLHAVEDQNAQAYQVTLWQKAFRMEPDVTWQTAVQRGITAEVGQALAGDPQLSAEWKARTQTH
jgi:hypothetical protein